MAMANLFFNVSYLDIVVSAYATLVYSLGSM